MLQLLITCILYYLSAVFLESFLRFFFESSFLLPSGSIFMNNRLLTGESHGSLASLWLELYDIFTYLLSSVAWRWVWEWWISIFHIFHYVSGLLIISPKWNHSDYVCILIIHIILSSSDPVLLLVLEFAARSAQRYSALIREDRSSEGVEIDPAQ